MSGLSFEYCRIESSECSMQEAGVVGTSGESLGLLILREGGDCCSFGPLLFN